MGLNRKVLQQFVDTLRTRREYGSGGSDIAKKLSEKLGWKLWDHLLTDEIARLMECDCRLVEEREERKDPLHYRLEADWRT